MTAVRSGPASETRAIRGLEAWLFVPGDRPERIAKALASSADRVIIDWEDAVAASRKDEARAATVDSLNAHPDQSPGRVIVRINPEDHPAQPDDRAVLDLLGPVTVMLAKAERPEAVAALTASGRPCLPLVESPEGIERSRTLAGVPGVTGLAFGCVDYLGDLGIPRSPEALLYAQSRLVNAARAAGLRTVADGPWIDFDDPAGLDSDIQRARMLGFTAKLTVHPRQIERLDALTAIPPERIDWARGVIAALEDAEARGEGVIRYQGNMIDPAVIKEAKQLLTRL